MATQRKWQRTMELLECLTVERMLNADGSSLLDEARDAEYVQDELNGATSLL